MKTRILVTVSIIVAFAAPAHAQLRDGRENPLTAARDLYASARYDEALAVPTYLTYLEPPLLGEVEGRRLGEPDELRLCAILDRVDTRRFAQRLHGRVGTAIVAAAGRPAKGTS